MIRFEKSLCNINVFIKWKYRGHIIKYVNEVSEFCVICLTNMPIKMCLPHANN